MKEINKMKGFTLVELLATIVILGIIMVVAIPNVIGILEKNRSTTYVEDAKKLVARAEYVVRSGKLKAKLADEDGKRCAFFNLAYLDNGEFENAPYGHPYDPLRSFVIASWNNKYYVRLVEPIDGGSYKGIFAAESKYLNTLSANKLTESFPSTPIEYKYEGGTVQINTTDFSDYLHNNIITEGNYNDQLPITCGYSDPNKWFDNKDYIYIPAQKITTQITDADLNSYIDIADDDLQSGMGGSIVGEVKPKEKWNDITGDISTIDKSIKVTLPIKNTTKVDVSYTITAGDAYVKLYKDSAGTKEFTGGTLKADKEEDEIIFYIKATQAAIDNNPYSSDHITTNLTFESIKYRTSIGASLKVYYKEPVIDKTAPRITNVRVSYGGFGELNVAWDCDDTDVQEYKVKVEGAKSLEVSAGTTKSKKITGLNVDGNAVKAYSYTIKVYGVDNSPQHNTASGPELASCGAEGPCASKSGSYQWMFHVDTSISNGELGTADIKRGETYTGTIKPGNPFDLKKEYEVPGSVSVSMVGNANPDYSYSGGTVTVRNITGNVSISGTCKEPSSCLIEGTKVLLKDGKTKNIEDVKYDDLVAVWNHDTGKIGYEYPIWIEKENSVEAYLKTTFSDGTVLKTTSAHGIFSLDHNEFISTLDTDKYHVGTRVAKVENGKIKEVAISKIETVHKSAKYYQILSTRHLNTITDNMLTTQYTVMLSNFYGFDKNITWSSTRDKYLSNSDNYYKYSEFKDIMPYYLFYGLTRNGEGKYLNNYGLDKEGLRNYFLQDPLNEEMWLPVETNIKGKRMWMVTTSLDKVTEKNKNKFKHEEGSYYTLPKNDDVKYYINSTDNKQYKPGVKVKVNCGIYFEAVKK